MAVLYVQHYQQFFDDTGSPLAYGKLYTYSAGTTSPKATYTDSSASVSHPNPIILDAAGKPDVGGCIFLEGSYKFVLHDADDVPLPDGTRDNITSFTAYSESNSGFFQSFSGDAATTTFTLSDDLGNDEKSLMVFSELEYSTNGTFASDASWAKGSGWTIAAGVATATGAISTALEQSTGITIIQGKSYLVKYTITRSAGTITPSLGGTAGTGRTASGTYSEVIIAGSTQTLSFGTSGFTGTLDNVSVRDLGGLSIRNPADYTLDGASLIFIKTPATGTNNIFVFAPYTLIGAAGAAQTASDAAIAAQAAAELAQAAAELAETNAETAETNAEAAAATLAGLSSTSTSSLTIATGAKTFTTQTGKGYTAGMWVLAVSAANPANYMHGSVTSYSGSSLVTSITNTGGSGTLADWNISVSGTRGATGATGADGAIGNFSGTATATLAAADLLLFSDNSAAGASRVSTPPNIDLGIFGSGAATDGKVLTADGAGGADWEEPLPSQSGNSGKYLTTNGTAPSWGSVSTSTSYQNNGYALNRYNFGLAIAASSGAAVTANRLYAVPHVVGETTTFTRIGINVTSAIAGNARLGIYNWAAGVPTTLVLDCGTVSTSSTGDKEITISQSLAAGVYALGVVFDAAPSVAVANERNLINYLVGDVSSTGNNVFQYVAHVYGALPTPFGTPTYTGTASPSLWLRKV